MAKAHPTKDEYNWEVYTKEYSAQVDEMERLAGKNGRAFLVKSWDIKEDGNIKFHDDLHDNWMCIYSAIHRLKPKSVFECGCGGMYHLKNIKTLFPNIDVSGCDLLQTQIDFGTKKFAIGRDILDNVKVKDFSLPNAIDDLEVYEFVFTQAVMMHLSQQKVLGFMRNMLQISSKYVFFVEGDQHNYTELLAKIGEDKRWNVTKPSYNSWFLERIRP
jgi:SAM-dependent methyltransferase